MADAPHAHGPEAHAASATPHVHTPNRRAYWFVFGTLFVLTILEVAIAAPQLGVPRTPMVLGLIAMALSKAALVALFFMHLKHEFAVLRLGVLLPFLFPAIYAVILIAEAAWRLVR